MTAQTVRLLELLGAEQTLRGTDDVLAMTLPLLEQVLEVHEVGLVAPLEGVEELMVTDGRLWFERSKARPPRLAPEALEPGLRGRLQHPPRRRRRGAHQHRPRRARAR